MDQYAYDVELKRLERTQQALVKNNMQATILEKASEVAPLVQQLIPTGSMVANGGSVSLIETGVMSVLRGGNYNFLDRETPGTDIQQLYRQSFMADYYLCSANALTENGEIYEMDGNSNRVAALAYGPEHVILVVGNNKIVPDIQAAKERAMLYSNPANAMRVGAKTPCAVTGKCSNCSSPGRICCTELILHQQRVKDRIHVILVNEPLGF